MRKPPSNLAKYSLTGTAFLVDVIGMIPIIGDVVNWLGLISLSLWIILVYQVRPLRDLKGDNKAKAKFWLNIVGGEGIAEAVLLFWPGNTIMVWSSMSRAQKKAQEEQGAKIAVQRPARLSQRIAGDRVPAGRRVPHTRVGTVRPIRST